MNIEKQQKVFDMKNLTLDDCRGIAARIWCDQDYQHMVMNGRLCEQIARMLMDEAQRQNEREKITITKDDIGELKVDF